MIGGTGGLGPAWTHGTIEAPAGVQDMGSWKAAVYTEEQQARLRVTAEGEPRDGVLEDEQLSQGPATFYKTSKGGDASADSWDTLVGIFAETAVELIKASRPELKVRPFSYHPRYQLLANHPPDNSL